MIYKERTNENVLKHQNFSVNFGYEPDPVLAKRLMDDLLLELNGPKIHRRNSAEDKPTRVRLPDPEHRELLKGLIEEWRATGPIPSAAQFFNNGKDLIRSVKEFRFTFWPGPDGRAYWLPQHDSLRASSAKPKSRALSYFLTLITNPNWAKLGGPCYRCGDYFLKKRTKHVYCSSKCGASTTAKETMRRRRDKADIEKVSLAKTLIAEWAETHRRTNCKCWVLEQSGTRLTSTWLTRAHNRGAITLPSQGHKGTAARLM